MKIAVIGAGLTGLTAAYDLARARQQVTVYEAAPQAGGLASGFRDARWEWALDRFYHHVFQGDTAVRQLAGDIGYGIKLFFRRPVTAQWWRGHLYAIDGVTQVLTFPGLPVWDRLRFGVGGAYLKYVTSDWQRLEGIPAADWTRRWQGEAVYRGIWQPMLEGKFGTYAPEVNMAWLWARLRSRSFRLGYFVGGFQGFVDALLQAAQQTGASVRLSTPAQRLESDPEGWTVRAGASSERYERVIATCAPALLAGLAPQLPRDYLERLGRLRSLGAVALALALKQPLTRRFYWMQGLRKEEFPFLSLVEHTNFVEREHYGGDYLVYCGDYLPREHEYFGLSQEELLARFLPTLTRFNPAFRPDWVRATWLHREPYAQPVVGLNHSRSILPLATPLPGLYWASMSQVYPWDRGVNYAIDIGHRVATEVLQRQVPLAELSR